MIHPERAATDTKSPNRPARVWGLYATCALLALASNPASAQSILYVNAASGGTQNGLGWETAFSSLQDAIDAATSTPSVNQIWVAAGTYRPDRGQTQALGDRFASFRLVAGVGIYGGFDGTENQLSKRDPAENPTILSGDLAGNDNGFANNAENSLNVVTGDVSGSTARLDGFIIRGGHSDFGFLGGAGGGIYITNGSPTIANCVIEGNSALFYGGGAAAMESSPRFENCIFANNETHNTSVSDGGGFASIYDADATLVNCLFTGNRADFGAAVGIWHGYANVINATMINNVAAFSGGAIDCGYDPGDFEALQDSAVTLTNSVLWANTSGFSGPQISQTLGIGSQINVSYCNVQGGEEDVAIEHHGLLTWGDGNIDADPLFVNMNGEDDTPGTADDNVHVESISPCIDAGTNGPVNVASDLAGALRILDGGSGSQIVDIGVYEFGIERAWRLAVCGFSRSFPTSDTVAFQFLLSRAPNTATIDISGRQADAFQILVDSDNVSPPQLANIDAFIRGEELFTGAGQTMPVRQREGDGGPTAGGWGTQTGTATYAINGKTVTVTVPLSAIDNGDNQFTYRLETYRFGEWQDGMQVLVFETGSVLLQRVGPRINDCNFNGVPDECELEGNDADSNGILDNCLITDIGDDDVDSDGVPIVPDVCQSGGQLIAFDDENSDECEDCGTDELIELSTDVVPAALRSASTCTPMQDVSVQNFAALLPGDEPDDWIDTQADNSMFIDNNLFRILCLPGVRTYGSISQLINVHSHYMGPGASEWNAYEFTGRMMINHPQGGVGVTFFSDYPNSDTYYRLRRYDDNDFHIMPHAHGVVNISGGETNSGLVPAANVWYRFKVEVEDTPTRSLIRAKVWADAASEPENWQMDCYDENPNRIRAGTIGLWSMGPGAAFWADLHVRLLDCRDPNMDADRDGDVDLIDFALFQDCLAGPNVMPAPTPPRTAEDCLAAFDADQDDDVDAQDFSQMQVLFTGSYFDLMGDWNGDGVVDLEDFFFFTACMNGPLTPTTPECGVFDFDADADVDGMDYYWFAEALAKP